MSKPSTPSPDVSRVFEAEYLGPSGDDEYTPAIRKAAREREDEDQADEPDAMEFETADARNLPAKVSLFA